MLVTLGQKTKSIFLNTESHKLSLEFEAIGKMNLITLSGALVAGGTLTGKINGTEVTVTFADDHATTMAAMATLIKAIPGVGGALVAGNVITVYPADGRQSLVLADWARTGTGTATVTVTESTGSKINYGTPVVLVGDGEKVRPFKAADTAAAILGISMHSPEPGELCTIIMRGYAVIFAQAGVGGVVPGPVTYGAFDSATGYDTYTIATIGDAIGFALDDGAVGDVVRVLLFK